MVTTALSSSQIRPLTCGGRFWRPPTSSMPYFVHYMCIGADLNQDHFSRVFSIIHAKPWTLLFLSALSFVFFRCCWMDFNPPHSDTKCSKLIINFISLIPKKIKIQSSKFKIPNLCSLILEVRLLTARRIYGLKKVIFHCFAMLSATKSGAAVEYI